MVNLSFCCSVLCLILKFVNALDEPTVARLPTNAFPRLYDIQLTSYIHRSDMNFFGRAQIVFQVMNDTNEVVIHQQDLIIDTNMVFLFQLNESLDIIKNIDVKNASYDESTNLFTIETNLNEILLKNINYVIQIHYEGILNTEPNGFYVVKHLNENNDTIMSAVTQLQPKYARKMFPCFDEPHLKAVFRLRVIHGNNVTAISNMPGQITAMTNDMVVTQFLDTPQMSTYSLSLILSSLPNISSNEDNNKIVHLVYSPLKESSHLDLMAQASQQLLPTFVSTLAVKYRLPQFVQIVLLDSRTNTTSNWGVITYSDSSIYFDSTDYVYQQEEDIIKHITQEIAKQFFGNIVSPVWWNNTWLVEGLVVVTSNLVMNIDFPKYRAADDFLINTKLDTMIVDNNGDIPLLEYDQITDSMSSYSKNKAACIIYMVMHAIGEDLFHEGLKTYLVQQENSTISVAGFFAQLDTLARSNGALTTSTSLVNIINTWTTQKGVPILTVQRDYTSGTVTVTQTMLGSSQSTVQWWAIPYNFIVKREVELDAWLTNNYGWFDQRTNMIFIQPTVYRNWSSTDWILLNKRSTGYYRINYDRNNWELLIIDLQSSERFLLVYYLNRAQLIDDSFIFAQDNLLQYDIPLKLAQFMKYENEHFVWQTFYGAYQVLERMIFGTDAYGLLSTYIKDLAGNIYDNFDGKNYHDVLTQKILINILCRASYYNCLENSIKIVDEFLNNPIQLPQNINEAYLHNGIRFIDANSVQILFRTAMESSDVRTRLLIFNGIGLTANLESIELIITATITTNNQSINDITINLTNSERKAILLSIVQNSQAGFKLLLDFLRTEQEAYRRIMINEIPDILKAMSYRSGTSYIFSRFQVLIEVYRNLQNQIVLNQYLEIARKNLEFLNSRLSEIRSTMDTINNNNKSDGMALFVPSNIIFIISQVILIFRLQV